MTTLSCEHPACRPPNQTKSTSQDARNYNVKDKMMRRKRQQSFTTPPSRVLIVDDHELMRDGLRLLIDSEPDFEICGEAMDDTSARRMIRESKPDVAVVDLTLQGGSGLDLIKWITQHHPETKTIVSTMAVEWTLQHD